MLGINESLVSLYLVEEGLNQGNLFAMEGIVAPNLIDHGVAPGQTPGVEGLKESVTTLRAAFPDVRFKIERMVGSEDRVAWRWRAEGTHLGERVAVDGTSIARICGGRIVEIWDRPEVADFELQLENTRQAADEVLRQAWPSGSWDIGFPAQVAGAPVLTIPAGIDTSRGDLAASAL